MSKDGKRAVKVSTEAHQPGQQVEPRFLTIPQVARELATSDSQIRRLLNSGELPGMQVGGRGIWRIERTRLEAYISDGHDKVQQLAASGALTEEDDSEAVDE